jgi:hypothetical protein
MLPNFTNYLLFNDDPKVVLLSSGERVTESQRGNKGERGERMVFTSLLSLNRRR